MLYHNCGWKIKQYLGYAFRVKVQLARPMRFNNVLDKTLEPPRHGKFVTKNFVLQFYSHEGYLRALGLLFNVIFLNNYINFVFFKKTYQVDWLSNCLAEHV